MTMNTISLALGADDQDFSRRFVELAFGAKRHILAYGGDDGSVVLIDGTQVKTARRFPDTVHAIAASPDGKRIAVGFGDGTTLIFVYKSLEGDTHPFLAALRNKGKDDEFFSQIEGMEDTADDEVSFPGPRFQTPVRSLVFDPRSNNLLACGSEDSGFCIVNATSSETLSKERFLAEHSASEHNETGIRGLAYYVGEKQSLLASLDLQGRLCVWDVSGDDPELEYDLLHKDGHKCVAKVDQGIINDSEPADQASFPVFGKSFVGLPGSVDVQLRSIDNIHKQLLLSSVDGMGHIEPIVSLAFSQDDKYVITGGRDGRLVLWEIERSDDMTGNFVKVNAEMDTVCTHILWVGSNILCAFANGTFASLDVRDVVPTDVPSSTSSTKKTKKSSRVGGGEEGSNTELKDAVAPKRLSKKSATTNDEDRDEDDDINFEEDDAATKKAKNFFIDDEADEDEDNGDDQLGQKPDETSLDDRTNDEKDDDSFGVQEDDNLDDGAEVAVRPRVAHFELPEPQPAFAPSSTALEFTRRIMCWNHMGTITLLRGDDSGAPRNTVDISFTDSAFRRPVTFTDNMDFIIGSLGEDGALFATDLADDDVDGDDELDDVVDGLNMSAITKAAVRKSQRKRMKKEGNTSSGSSIYFHRFETFGSLNNKDWVLTLPDGELAVGCACGEGWAACITNRRFLRFFSAGGNQGPVIWLAGDPVTIVGRSKFVAVFYHEGLPFADGTQKLGYIIYDGITCEIIVSGSLSCISKRSSLNWAGFSKEGSLMAMDSDGMLSMLVAVENQDKGNKSFSWNWAPMLDTVGLRKSLEDSFWPVTVQDGKFVCVPLRGGNEHPDAARRPVTAALNLRMPFAYSSNKTAALEELSVRANLALNQKKFSLESTSAEGYDVTELEDEYNSLCAQVDKVTLKFFMATVESGKLESALDLTNRLHLEKSFDIAVTIAERMNHRNLSDRIEEVKDRKFAMNADNSDILHDDEGYPPGDSMQTYKETHRVPQSRQISPETQNLPGMKRPLRDVADNTDDIVEPPTKKKTINPFAKKRLESPARPSFSPAKESPARVGISRRSQFSAQSREISKVSKKLL